MMPKQGKFYHPNCCNYVNCLHKLNVKDHIMQLIKFKSRLDPNQKEKNPNQKEKIRNSGQLFLRMPNRRKETIKTSKK